MKRGTDSYASPVHTSHLSWRGSPQITMQTRGTKELESIGKATQRKFNRSNGGYRAARAIGKKSSVFLQHGDPSMQIDVELSLNDVWIDYIGLDTIDDVGELSWDELADYTWMDFYGSKMYSWDGNGWVPISDQQKEEYNFDLLENTVVQLRSVKGDLAGAFSEIKQTKNEIYTFVRNDRDELQSVISQQADKIGLVVQGTGANASIRAAEIWASIDTQLRQSQVKISADIIELDGDAVASSLYGTSVEVEDLETEIIVVTDTINMPPQIDYESGSYWSYNLGAKSGTMAETIVKAELSTDGKTLTLTKMDGNTIPFSKATTLTPSWSGSVLTMAAEQTNGGVTSTVASKEIGFGGSYGDHDVELEVVANGGASKNTSIANTVDVPVAVNSLNSGQTAPTQRYTKTIPFSVSSLLTTGSYNTSGTKTPGSSYIGFSSVTFTIPNASGFSRSSTYNTQNSNLVGTISKSGLSGNEYLFWTVGGKKYHIVVNT